MSVRGPVIAVDGPAAAGKGTLAKRLAKALGVPYLDTGLLYRAVGRLVLDAGDSPADPAEVFATRLTPADLARKDLRTPDVARAASEVAAQPAVREALIATQRSFVGPEGAVLDGRDIGTVIFPDAEVKLFITASAATRALRRFLQQGGDMQAPDAALVLKETQEALSARDLADSQRAVAPLKPAGDALQIETDHLDADQVLAQALSYARERLTR